MPSEDKESLELTFDSIYRQLGSMQRLVNDFRDYEKLKDPRPSKIDLNKLIREVVVPYTEGEQSNGVILQLDPELKEFSADTNQLVQVLNKPADQCERCGIQFRKSGCYDSYQTS